MSATVYRLDLTLAHVLDWVRYMVVMAHSLVVMGLAMLVLCLDDLLVWR